MSNEKADKAEKDKKRKAEKNEKDRVESLRQSERARIFDDFLSGAGSKGCCESCNYYVKIDGEPKRCKMGHKDFGPGKEFCPDSSEQRYRLKK